MNFQYPRFDAAGVPGEVEALGEPQFRAATVGTWGAVPAASTAVY